MHSNDLPVAVIGGGPVGLAAAAHLIARQIPVKLYEAGAAVGANVRDWGHVRVFTPWRYSIDAAPRSFSNVTTGANPIPTAIRPAPRSYASYLDPWQQLQNWLRSSRPAPVSPPSRARAWTRSQPRPRQARPFVLSVATAAGARRDLARAVIDASGTWTNPNPLGADGLPAEGEAGARRSDRLRHSRCAGPAPLRPTLGGRMLVVGGGPLGRQCAARSGAAWPEARRQPVPLG